MWATILLWGVAALLTTAAPSTPPAAIATHCEVAVVGGGIGGLYTAIQIHLSNTLHGRVCVFEGERFLGGRIRDVFINTETGRAAINDPDAAGVTCSTAECHSVEPVGLGAWRFDESHHLVRSIIDHYAVPHRPWQRIPRRWEARGVLVDSAEQLLKEAFPHFTMPPNVTDLYTLTKGRLLEQLTSLGGNSADILSPSVDVWRRFTEAGNPDMQAFLQQNIGYEGFAYWLATNGGFRGDFFRPEPLTFYQYLEGEYGDTGNQRRPRSGMSALIRALAQHLQKLKVPIFKNERVTSIDVSKNGRKGRYVLKTSKGRSITAGKVIINAPPELIRSMDGSITKQLVQHPVFQSILPEPVFKAAMLFAHPWWNDTLKPLEQIQTDSTCLGQVLPYLDQGPTGGHVLHAAYSDGPCNLLHWPAVMDSLGGLPPHKQETVLAGHLVRELQLLFPNTTIPMPKKTVWHFWEKGGWHYQRPGHYITLGQVEKWASRPLPKEDVFLVNEAYGMRRAWAQGSLATARHALTEGWNMTTFPF